MLIHEPTVGSDGRLRSVVEYDDGRKAWKSYPKLLLEQKIGRELVNDETCDHIDNDFTNNDPDNLQVLTRAENIRKQAALNPAELYLYTCPVCRCDAQKAMSEVRHNWKLGKSGPVCSKSCAGLIGKDLIHTETIYDYDPETKHLEITTSCWKID